MAKLTGVKTIDMVGGEITKVEYNGELYAKTDDSVKGGDLFQLRKGHCVIGGEVDAFYTTKQYGGHSVILPTTFGGNATVVQSKGSGVAYRKESTQAPSQSTSIESRVETLETKVAALEGSGVCDGEYRKVTDREPRVGDFVKYNSKDDDDIFVGKFYEVVSVDADGDPRFIDENGYTTYAGDFEDWELFEKVGAKEEPLKVGDYAKVIKPGIGEADFEIGEIVEIASLLNPAGEKDRLFVKHLYNDVKWYMSLGTEIIKATDEEVSIAKKELAEAKAKKAEIKRWAAIGRKPNEFKVGDAVRYKKAFTTVTEVNREIIRINQSNNRDNQIAVQPSDLTLVFPAEAKFE